MNTHIFPEESSDGVVTLVGNKIRCEGKNQMGSGDVSIDDLQYAYVTVNNNNQVFLFLFDHHQHYIPVNFTGFKNVYQALTEKFSFNDQLFFESIHKKEILKKEIWRRTYVPNYAILAGDLSDYEEGFEIQSPQPQFVLWETTYQSLENNSAVYFDRSPYGQMLLKFKFPIRIGNIQIVNFFTYFDNVRKDAPVSEYYVDCFDAAGTDKSYIELKQVLTHDLGGAPDSIGYERADQKNMYFNSKGIRLSICYTYNSTWQFDGGYTSFHIKNTREYEALLIDEVYESELVVSDFLILPGKIRMRSDYKSNSKVKRRQEKITEQFKDKTIIWRDDVNHKIGFSCGAFSQVYDQDQIKSLQIQNVLPARGSGSSNLELILELDKNHYEIFSEKCHYFDRYADRLKQLLKKELTFGEEYHDC